VSDSNGGNLQQLTRERDDASSPTWSPDSREICYVVRSGRAGLRKISASGGESTALRTGVFANLTSPDWSPDGKSIIFTSGSVSFSLWVVPAAGGEAVQLVAGEDPCWAPNSRTVIFTRRVNNNRVLSLLDVPTKHVKDVLQISGSCSQPAWAR
jgi:TolB protein